MTANVKKDPITPVSLGHDSSNGLAVIVLESDDVVIGKNLDGIITSCNHRVIAFFASRPLEYKQISEGNQKQEKLLIGAIGLARQFTKFRDPYTPGYELHIEA